MSYEKILLDMKRTKEERTQAAFQLFNSKDDSALESLIKALLTDPSPIVRHECAFILGEKKLPYVGKYLMQAVEKDPSLIVKHEALSAIGSPGDPSYITFIKNYINYPDAIVSDTAEMAIERIQRYKGGKCFV